MKIYNSTKEENLKALENVISAQRESISNLKSEVEKISKEAVESREYSKKIEKEMKNLKLENKNMKKDFDHLYMESIKTSISSDFINLKRKVEEEVEMNSSFRERFDVLETKVMRNDQDSNEIRLINAKTSGESKNDGRKGNNSPVVRKTSNCINTVKEKVASINENQVAKCAVCKFPAKGKTCLDIHGKTNAHDDMIRAMTASIPI